MGEATWFEPSTSADDQGSLAAVLDDGGAKTMTTVSLLGSTGSIGTQTLDVLERFHDEFEVTALGAGSCSPALVAQVERWRPRCVVVRDVAEADALRALIDSSVEILVGSEGLADAARRSDVSLNAVMGFAGLPVTLSALAAGKRLALANKESLIAAAPVVETVRRSQLPVVSGESNSSSSGTPRLRFAKM